MKTLTEMILEKELRQAGEGDCTANLARELQKMEGTREAARQAATRPDFLELVGLAERARRLGNWESFYALEARKCAIVRQVHAAGGGRATGMGWRERYVQEQEASLKRRAWLDTLLD